MCYCLLFTTHCALLRQQWSCQHLSVTQRLKVKAAEVLERICAGFFFAYDKRIVFCEG